MEIETQVCFGSKRGWTVGVRVVLIDLPLAAAAGSHRCKHRIHSPRKLTAAKRQGHHMPARHSLEICFYVKPPLASMALRIHPRTHPSAAVCGRWSCNQEGIQTVVRLIEIGVNAQDGFSSEWSRDTKSHGFFAGPRCKGYVVCYHSPREKQKMSFYATTLQRSLSLSENIPTFMLCRCNIYDGHQFVSSPISAHHGWRHGAPLQLRRRDIPKCAHRWWPYRKAKL